MGHPAACDAYEGSSERLSPTELPLRPLCPGCGSERVSLSTAVRVTFEVVSARGCDQDLQVLSHQLDGCGWDDDDPAECRHCGWTGPAAQLGAAPHDGQG